MSSARLPLRDGVPDPWATEWGEDRFGVFQAFTVAGVVQRLRWIPPGTFWMGSPEDEPDRFKDEGPRHRVELRQGFWLADTPCTQALWQAVMGANPSRFQVPSHPVEQVSWDDSKEFLAQLEERVPGLGARLPSEAEWEYACRAGTTGARWTDDLDAIAWYSRNSGRSTHPVAQKAPNPWGLHDMLGNVYEWCEDFFGAYDAAPAIDPTGPRTGSSRVNRGGSWLSYARSVRAALRSDAPPGSRSSDLGLRLARGRAPGQAAAEPPGTRSVR